MSHVTLASIREVKGLSIEEAARCCDISAEKMKLYEENPGTIPVSLAIELRRLYNIPLDYIKLE